MFFSLRNRTIQTVMVHLTNNRFRISGVVIVLSFLLANCTKSDDDIMHAAIEAEMCVSATSRTMPDGGSTKGWVTETGGAGAFVDIADPANPGGTPPPRTIMLGAWNSTAGQSYFTGVLFSKDDDDNKWHANPKKYYPLRATVDLLAYSSGKPLIADWESGHKVTLQVTDTQDDILYASARASSMESEATMTFHHSQAWLTFELSSNVTALHVDSLYWENVYHSGALHLEYNEAVGQSENPTATWDFFTQEKGNVGVDDPFGALFTATASRTPVPISIDSSAPTQLNMLLPEQPHSSLVVLYTLCGHQFAKRIKASDLSSTTWERSRRYTYKLEFSVTGISLDPNVEIRVAETIDRVNSVEIITGIFSTAANKTVAFSKGNLQYRPSDGKWRFAEHQWDYAGESGAGWTDLFQWEPGDWGVNIRVFEYFRPSVVDGEFRSLSADEWNYLLNTRTTKSGHRWFTGTLKWGPNTGESTNGLFLLPDKFAWHESYGKEPTDAQYNQVTTGYTVDNTIGARFDKLEAAGVVFIPYAGKSVETIVSDIGDKLYLWTRTIGEADKAKCVECPVTDGYSINEQPVENGFSVRLATDLNPEAL